MPVGLLTTGASGIIARFQRPVPSE